MASCNVVFTVEGRGPFPLDMLRRDECFPYSETDANAAQRDETRKVTLCAPNRFRFWCPTLGRWESFGWKVLEVEAR